MKSGWRILNFQVFLFPFFFLFLPFVDKLDNFIVKLCRFRYTDSKRHGHGEMIWSDKTTYVGEWFEDERCGEGEMRYNTGEVFVGKWKNDRQEGMGRLDCVNGDSLKVSKPLCHFPG